MEEAKLFLSSEDIIICLENSKRNNVKQLQIRQFSKLAVYKIKYRTNNLNVYNNS